MNNLIDINDLPTEEIEPLVTGIEIEIAHEAFRLSAKLLRLVASH